MSLRNLLSRPRTDMQIARILAGACVVLYLCIFSILFFVASGNGASFDTFVGLNLPAKADTQEYVGLAHTMLDAGRFSITPTASPEYARPPGYPAFLAMTLAIFGTLTVVPFIQFLLTACTVALIYLTGVRYFPRPVALSAAILYMIDPIVIYAAWIPITESLFMILLIGSVYTIGVQFRRTWLPFAAAGVLLGLAVYMRPIGLYVAPIIACMALAHATSWRTGLFNAAIFMIATFCIVSPWMTRNYLLAGHFSFDSVRDWQFYSVNMPLFEQVRTGIGYQTTLENNNERFFGTHDYFILRSFEYADREASITRSVLLAHPFQYLAFHLFKSAQFFVSSSIVNVTYHMYQLGILTGDHAQGEGAWGMLTQHRWRDAFVQTFTHIPRLIERMFLALAYASAVYATAAAICRKDSRMIWIICAFLLLNAFAILTGPGSDDTRYRMPSEPFVFLLASYGAYSLWPRIQKRIRLPIRSA